MIFGSDGSAFPSYVWVEGSNLCQLLVGAYSKNSHIKKWVIKFTRPSQLKDIGALGGKYFLDNFALFGVHLNRHFDI